MAVTTGTPNSISKPSMTECDLRFMHPMKTASAENPADVHALLASAAISSVDGVARSNPLRIPRLLCPRTG